MQFLMTTALLGSLAAMSEASRCKNRPGHHHHHNNGTSILPVPSQYSEAPQEASTTTVEISSYAAAPSSSSTLAVTEPLVPLVPSSSNTISASSSIGTTLSSSTIAVSETSVEATSAPAPASSSVETTLSTSSSSVAPTTTEVTSTVAQATTSAASVATTSVEATSVEATSVAVTSATDAAPSEVAIANAPASAEMCADNQDTLLTEWGLVVSNFRVEESSVEGTVCTTYNGMVTLANGQAAVKFTADANLVFDEATINDNKYYSNAGLGANVPSQLNSISSIPASYSWSRTNTTNFRGK